ncbi:MAG: GIY-YIG nuclease family protein [Vicinamibacterales bacterium]
MHGLEKAIVYIVQSETSPEHFYVGMTNDVEARLEWHNTGPSGHTRRYRPWRLLVSMKFRTEQAAVRFERYLKSGSGRAFAKRHFGVS